LKLWIIQTLCIASIDNWQENFAPAYRPTPPRNRAVSGLEGEQSFGAVVGSILIGVLLDGLVLMNVSSYISKS
jgi:hypothetical protein